MGHDGVGILMLSALAGPQTLEAHVPDDGSAGVGSACSVPILLQPVLESHGQLHTTRPTAHHSYLPTHESQTRGLDPHTATCLR